MCVCVVWCGVCVRAVYLQHLTYLRKRAHNDLEDRKCVFFFFFVVYWQFLSKLRHLNRRVLRRDRISPIFKNVQGRFGKWRLALWNWPHLMGRIAINETKIGYLFWVTKKKNRKIEYFFLLISGYNNITLYQSRVILIVSIHIQFISFICGSVDSRIKRLLTKLWNLTIIINQ